MTKSKSLHVLVASLIASAVSIPAFSADAVLQEPQVPVAPDPIIDTSQWGGFYAGVYGGYSWFDANVSGVGEADGEDLKFGGYTGYNYEFGNQFVTGIELNGGFANALPALLSHGVEANTLAGTDNQTLTGYNLGAGFEKQILEGVTARVEYGFSDYGDEAFSNGGGGTNQIDLTEDSALGLKWGAYHLGRPGNPIAQANHFLDFAKPQDDELIALDIEHDNPKKWISFKDAEIFARQIYARIGRYPVLYTNHNTAQRIASRRAEFPLLSRLQLWYARFKGDVRGAFPMGNWESYTMWQFSAHPNCNKRRCLYRVRGTEPNIDVNVSTLTIAEFDKAWPFNGLVPVRKPAEDSNPDILMVNNEKPQIDVASQQITTASIIAPTPRADNEPLSKEASFQLASINLDDIAVPTARERDDQPSYGITTTDYQPEYEVVVPKSEYAEDLTMQLQYLAGAL
ncbi:outer-membrane immunogenic protein [Nymphon striatum]|nr:outer-membrane immunogenic protein [Nymphon striatum]